MLPNILYRKVQVLHFLRILDILFFWNKYFNISRVGIKVMISIGKYNS